MDYKETLEYISSVNWKGSVPGLERISILLKRIEDPQKDLRFIHIGGTNGKGSTSAFISYILKAAGFKTGLFISPYIEVFNERMQINNQNISDEELAEIATYIRPYAETMEDLPTEFELNTAIAFEYFKRNRCDIVVLEVGMGGEFDATNVIDAPMAAVLTSIGLDHTAFLGDTVEKIAATKSGIIKEGCQVILYQQDSAVTDVIKERCRIMNACLHISEPEKLTLLSSDINGQLFDSPHGELYINLPAAYQKNNLATALKTIEVLNGSGLSISDEDIRHGLKNAVWPGRFEVLNKEPVFIADGAHNPQGIKAAAESISQAFPEKKCITIFGVLRDKDYKQMLDIITPAVKFMLCVSPDNPRALNTSELKKEAISRNIPAEEYGSLTEAVNTAFEMAEKEDVILALGSLYMIGDIKNIFRRIKMKISENSCNEFIEVLASESPVPGGGGAAALCAAIGTALGNMVGSLTSGRKNYLEVQEEIVSLKEKADILQKRLLELIDEDAECFKPLAAAYKMPSETIEDAELKKETLEKCSKDACMVPLEIMEQCCEAIDLTNRFGRIGSRLAISDAGCSAAILEGALKAASLNIFINTKCLKDRTFAEEINKKALDMINEYSQKAEKIFSEISEQLK